MTEAEPDVDLTREWVNASAQLRECARQDAVAFVQYVMRDERTGRPWDLAPMHEAWHDEIDKHDRLIIWSHPEAGKTAQISIGRTLFEVGKDPTKRVVVLSNTIKQARKIVSACARYIESSHELHEVFPDLQPGGLWTQTELRVKGARTGSKDPTIQACGVHGAILGARIDLLIIDDILDFENCRTKEAREDLWQWLQSTVIGRLTADSRVVVVGNAYHPKDALHQFAMLGYRALRYPVLDDKGQPRWPAVWPLERIAQRKGELTPVEFSRQLLCVARDDAERRFKFEWIQRGLERGNGKQLVHALRYVPAGCRVFTGVDLAVGKKKTSGVTSFFTLLIHPNKDREVLNVEAGRLGAPDIVKRIVDHHFRYQAIVVVENNAAQDYLVQFTQALSAVPIVPFTTGANKAHPEFGIESLAVEMANGKWIIPNEDGRCEPEVDMWVNEMLDYDPTVHTGDRLMSSWFAREGARMGTLEQKVEFGRIDLSSR